MTSAKRIVILRNRAKEDLALGKILGMAYSAGGNCCADHSSLSFISESQS